MPFKSKKQRRWMFANYPAMARRWSSHTPKGENLPETAQQKKSAENPPLSEGQQRALERFLAEDSPGLLAAHGTGTGKTRLSLEAIKAYGQPADVVVPAALRSNYRKEMEKYDMVDLPVTIHSLEGVASGTSQLTNPVLVVDESQRIRGKGKSYKNLLTSPATKKLLLSGTPVVNRPSDILPQLHLLTGDNKYKMSPDNFDNLMSQPEPRNIIRRFLSKLTGSRQGKEQENPWGLNQDQLSRYRRQVIKDMQTNVDVSVSEAVDMPEVKHEYVRVPMTEAQAQLSRAILKELPESTVQRIREGLPPDRQDFGAINAFLSASRQLMNGDPRMMMDEESPKIRRAVNDAMGLLRDNPDAKWVAYSNFLGSGSNIYRKMLEESDIPYGMFTGNMSKDDREQAIKDYNEGKIRALLLSGAGAEGLDLKGTTMMQLIEPAWNQAREQQASARGVRRGSHAHLPPEQRKVLIKHYLSARNDDISVDDYLRRVASDKEKQVQRLIRALNDK